MYSINFYPYKDFTYDIFDQKVHYHSPLSASISILTGNNKAIIQSINRKCKTNDMILILAELLADYGIYRYISINRHVVSTIKDIIIDIINKEDNCNALICSTIDKSFDTVITYKNHSIYYNDKVYLSIDDLNKYLYLECEFIVITCKE